MHIERQSKNMKVRGHLGDIDRGILYKVYWLSTGSSGGFLWTR